jgi:hypothetical protein
MGLISRLLNTAAFICMPNRVTQASNNSQLKEMRQIKNKAYKLRQQIEWREAEKRERNRDVLDL